MHAFYVRMQWIGLLPLALLMWSGVADDVLGWSDPLNSLIAFGSHDPLASVVVTAALLIEVVGPMGLLMRRYRAVAALVLSIYTMAAALVFHDFWRHDDPSPEVLQDFCRNLALAGALLYVFAASRDQDAVAVTLPSRDDDSAIDGHAGVRREAPARCQSGIAAPDTDCGWTTPGPRTHTHTTHE